MDSCATADQAGFVTNPLSAFELCRDTEFDAIQTGLSGVFACNGNFDSLKPCSGAAPSFLRAVQLTHMTLAVVRFGQEIRINVEAPAYNLTLPVRGRTLCRFGSQNILIGPGLCAVNTPGVPCVVPRCGADVETLCIKIRREALEETLAAMIGRPVRSVVRFALELDLDTPRGRSWLSVLSLLLSELASPASLARTSWHHLDQLEQLVISTLLRAQPHDFSRELRRETAPMHCRSVKRVVDAIQDAPERPWSLATLAKIAGTSGRRLQQGFQSQIGMSPMAYLQNVRLERVHRDLLKDVGQVTALSTSWGFTHLGRFASAYRARYGESPRDTRRRSQSIMLLQQKGAS